MICNIVNNNIKIISSISNESKKNRLILHYDLLKKNDKSLVSKFKGQKFLFYFMSFYKIKN